VCESENYGMSLVLDVNVELYPMGVGDRFTLGITPTLYTDGTKDAGIYDQSKRPRISDAYEYVMHGRVYRCDLDKEGRL
jgi:DNA-directed RNA polymerase I, II, and III subunit RPABC3